MGAEELDAFKADGLRPGELRADVMMAERNEHWEPRALDSILIHLYSPTLVWSAEALEEPGQGEPGMTSVFALLFFNALILSNCVAPNKSHDLNKGRVI